MIEIREVRTRRERKEFVEFPLRLYKGVPSFVPPLYGDEMKLFTKKNIYAEQADSVFYNAYRDGKMVGRIQGILQHAANRKWNQKRVRFTRFDSIDDREVSTALFSALEKWAKEKGMEELVGPLGYSDLDREGLLIEGFDEPSTFEEQYNYAYYPGLVEDFGFVKEVDWTERQLFYPAEPDERLERVSRRMMEKYNLRFGEAKNTNDFLKKYADGFFEIIDLTYNHLYQTVPFTPAMKKLMIENFKLIIDLRFVAVILDENDRIVCFGLCFPAIGEALQKSGGRLTPAALVRLLKTIKHPKVLDLGLIGVLPEYRNKGIGTAIISGLMRMLREQNIEYAETNLNLEDNQNIQNQWKAFDNRIHKRRRSYVKKIEE